MCLVCKPEFYEWTKGVQKEILQIVHHLLYVYIALWYNFNDNTLLMQWLQ